MKIIDQALAVCDRLDLLPGILYEDAWEAIEAASAEGAELLDLLREVSLTKEEFVPEQGDIALLRATIKGAKALLMKYEARLRK